ncbi:aldehyde dehydrogenase [Caulobacter soli]|uniref:aldehyde dehydrogenase n=1 Tax=Caulobacter soli TaxID=2708539 RepID=UPI0013EA4B2F|nr:aldehyde dehydrogenase [Caulobacter soli]
MEVGLLIGDLDDAPAGRPTFERRNPVSDNLVSVAVAATPADALAAADAAQAAFEGWSGLGPNARRAVLSKAADLMAERTDEFVDLMMAETGSTAGWAHFNLQATVALFREAAAMTTQIGGEVIPSDRPGTFAMAVRQPAGVVLGIAPWNAPIILGARAIAMPLACGNTVVLKASEVCPATHRLIGQVVRDAGAPAGAVNVINNAPGDAEAVVNALIAHPAVKRINFTGSTHVGRLVARQAALHLKPVLLELGGKAPLIVLDDADLDEAVNATIFGAYLNQGQICMSTERVIVDEQVADAFVAKLAARARMISTGDPAQGDVALGGLVDVRSARRVSDLIADAVDKGAVLAAGGEAKGTIVAATVIDHVSPAMRIHSEESFGPVASIIRVQGVEEAIRVANDTEYGLSAAIYGRDVGRALAVAKRIRSGICHINGPTVHDEPQMPFGGVGSSGYGRFGGKAAIAEFTDLRWITITTGSLNYPF